MRDLPPLKAVRAFEVCYRLRSFRRAGAQLNVGQPAISHQIRQLERDLGATLFVKKGAVILATEEADAFYEIVAPALAQIEMGGRRIRRQAASLEQITLATYPGVAAYWASPRIAKLRQAGLPLSIRIITVERDIDIALDDVDCAILFGRGDWTGCECIPLISERVAPVAAPNRAAAMAELSPAEQLERGPLIHLVDPERRWFEWSDWRDRYAPDTKILDRSVVVSNHGLAVHQALQGEGVALGWIGVVADLLAGGALVRLHHADLVSNRGYWLVARMGFKDTAIGTMVCDALAPDGGPDR